MRRLRLVPLALAVLAPLAVALAAQAQAPGRQLSAQATATEITYGARLRIAGSLSQGGQPVGGEVVEAQADPYPFHGFVSAGLTRTAADGSYAFTRLRPGRNARYRVVDHGPGSAASPALGVTVDPTYRLRSHSRGPGDTRLAVSVRHTRALGSPPVSVFWFVAREGSRRFRLAAETSTHEVGPGRTRATASVDPPSKRFVFRVCFNPRWGAAMGPRSSNRRCHHHDYTVAHPVR